jgi:hypothetical protein
MNQSAGGAEWRNGAAWWKARRQTGRDPPENPRNTGMGGAQPVNTDSMDDEHPEISMSEKSKRRPRSKTTMVTVA